MDDVPRIARPEKSAAPEGRRVSRDVRTHSARRCGDGAENVPGVNFFLLAGWTKLANRQTKFHKICKTSANPAKLVSLGLMVILTPKKWRNFAKSGLRVYNINIANRKMCDLLAVLEVRRKFAVGFAGEQIRGKSFLEFYGGRFFFHFRFLLSLTGGAVVEF